MCMHAAATIKDNPSLTPGLLNAFKFAEYVRRELVESRQKSIESREKEEDEEKKAGINEDAPGITCDVCVSPVLLPLPPL